MIGYSTRMTEAEVSADVRQRFDTAENERESLQ
jgi:hypothetical protein